MSARWWLSRRPPRPPIPRRKCALALMSLLACHATSPHTNAIEELTNLRFDIKHGNMTTRHTRLASSDQINPALALKLNGNTPSRSWRPEPLNHPPGRATYRLATYVPSSAPLTTSSADTDANADEHADARATRRLLPMPLLRLPPLVPRLSSYPQPRVRVL